VHLASATAASLRRSLPSVATPLAFAALVVAGWEISVRALRTPAYLVPRPSSLPSSLPPDIWSHLWVTAQEACLGFAIANAVAFAIAVACAQSRILERGLYPIAIALKTTPLVAVAPLLILWFGTGLPSKIVAAGLISFFPMLVNTIKGLGSVDADQRELFSALRANRWHVFRRLQLPTALPYVFAALKISTSLAVVGAIVGEFVGANVGLGFLILQASYHLDSAQLFVSIVFAALLGFTMFALVGAAEHFVVRWNRIEA